MPHAPGLGAIYGIVAENGVPQIDAPVHLLDRSGPKFIRSTRTAGDGGFTFSGLNTETNDYMVLATDETGDPVSDPYKNALIQDRVQPVGVSVGTNYPSAWLSKLMALAPVVVAPGPFLDSRYDQVSIESPGLGPGVIEKQGGGWSLSDSPAFPNSAINLPVINLSDASWAWVKAQSGARFTTDTGTTFTILVVADFSRSWGVTQRYISSASDYIKVTSKYIYASLQPICYLGFDGIDKIRFELPAYDSTNTSVNQSSRWDGGIVLKTYDHTLGSVPSGFALVAISFRGGSVCNLFVDGTEVVLDNVTVPVTVSTYGNEHFMGFAADAALHDYSRVNNSTGPRFALYAFTPRFVAAAQLNDLKDSLENGGFPTETGYARALTVDLPAFYYRLDELNSASTKIVEHYEGDTDSLTTADLLFKDQAVKNLLLIPGMSLSFTAGPTLGRSALGFSGAECLYGNWVGLSLGYRNFTLSFWMKHTERDGTQTIVAVQESSTDSTVKTFAVQIMADGNLELFLGGADQTASFSFVAELDTWYLVHIVVHKSEEEIRLYIDGSLEETISTTTVNLSYKLGVYETLFYYDNSTHLNYYQGPLVIGGKWNGSAVSNGFKGMLSEVVGFTYPLTATRIAGHYANKDVI